MNLMPFSSLGFTDKNMGKRRQQNPGKDFVKKKRKVGKAKVPNNATNTTFVSHGISVPTQLAAKSEHVPTTKRKLSFTVGMQ